MPSYLLNHWLNRKLFLISANHGHATAIGPLTHLTVVHTLYNFSVYGYNGK